MRAFLLRLWRWLPLPSSLRWLIASSLAPRYRVAVAAIVLDREGRILLCEHTYRRAYPWGLPGGDLEPGEEPADAVRREVWEETGLCIQVVRLLLVTNSRMHRHVGLIYLCRPLGGTFRPSAEVSNVRFCPPDALPALLPSEREVIARSLALADEGC